MLDPEKLRLPKDCQSCPVHPFTLYSQEHFANAAEVQRLRRGIWAVRAGQNIYIEGQQMKHILTLFDGWAFRYRALPDGTRQIFAFLLPGDTISIGGLVSDRLPFSIDALTDCAMCILDRAGMANYIEGKAPLVRRVWSHCMQEQDAMQGRVVEVGRRDAYERVAHFLITTFDRLRSRGLTQETTFPFPPRHVHVADTLGLTPIHVSRIFRKLEDNRILVRHRRMIEIVDMNEARRLKALVDGVAPS